MKSKKIYLFLFIVFIRIANPIDIFQDKVFADSNLKHILVLNSDDSSSSCYTKTIINAISSNSSNKNYIIHVENMDMAFYNEIDDLYNTLYPLYKNKFKNYKFDAIIGTDELSLYFLEKYHDELFKDTPVVFCELNKSSLNRVSNNKLFYAVEEIISVKETVDISLKFHKNYKTVFIPINLEFASDYYKNIFEDIKIKYKKKNINIITYYGCNMDDLSAKIKKLPKDTIILLTTSFRNQNNDVLSLEYMCKVISKDTSYPIYGLWNELLDCGIVGGKLADGSLQGKYAASLIVNILQKKPIANRIITIPNKYIFDYNKLKKYDIDFNLLPKNCIIYNKPSNFYSIKKDMFYTFVFLSLLILLYLLVTTFNKIKLQKSLKENLEYDRLKTEFFSNLSHELKTPLNLIFGTTQLLEVTLKNHTQSKNLNRHIHILKQNSYRMIRLVNNLIDITKMDCGYFHFNLQNLNIVNVIEDITLSVADYVKIKNISITFDTDVEEKIMAIDPNSIERIMLNLLSNSIKFTNPGDKITVNIWDKTDCVLISVKDTGIGIPKNKLDVIFDRFRQVDKSLTRNQEGSGIGLSLVKSLVHMHNGEIHVISEYGQGSEFIIKLPVTILDDKIDNMSNYNLNSNNIEKISIEFSDIYSLD